MLSDDVIKFIRTHLSSVWALEVLLKMSAEPTREWTVGILVRDLRASTVLVPLVLRQFERSELIVRGDGDIWRWQPKTPELARLAKEVADAQAVTPFRVIQAIVEAPNYRLRQLADAFQLRRE
jgi:hypothetical protein